MAQDTQNTKPKVLLTIGGVDESINLINNEPALGGVAGTFPFFYGMLERMFGKKIIDFNPGQAVYGIQQTFNGVCLYGYYVQTNTKLYYHVCDAPPDLRIKFWPNV